LPFVAGGKVHTIRVFVFHIGGCTLVKSLVCVVQVGPVILIAFVVWVVNKKEFDDEQRKSLKMRKCNSFYGQKSESAEWLMGNASSRYTNNFKRITIGVTQYMSDSKILEMIALFLLPESTVLVGQIISIQSFLPVKLHK
jgi:hypothetical protein